MADENELIDEQPEPEQDATAEPGVEHEIDEMDEHPGANVEEPVAHVEPTVEPPAQADAPANGDVPSAAGDETSPKKWYIIHTYSGFENKVQESLRIRADA